MPLRLTLIADLPDRRRFSASLGPAHRLACLLLEDRDSDHHESQDKIFAIRPPWAVHGSNSVEIVINLLTDNLEVVDNARRRLASLPPVEINLGRNLPLLQPALQVSGMSWQHLSESAPRSLIRFGTLSPVMFSRSGQSNPLPDPYLAITQLGRRWNSHVDHESLHIEQEDIDRLARNVVVHSFDIRTESVRVKGWKTGFMGDVSFSTTLEDPMSQAIFSALFAFAEYSGIGALTTQGLGAVQLLSD